MSPKLQKAFGPAALGLTEDCTTIDAERELGCHVKYTQSGKKQVVLVRVADVKAYMAELQIGGTLSLKRVRSFVEALWKLFEVVLPGRAYAAYHRTLFESC